jgi:16S rRNA processing protein RimM
VTIEKTLIEVGFVERAHGLAGEVLVRLHHEGSSVLSDVKRLLIQKKASTRRELEIAGVRASGKGHLVAFGGVQSREVADSLRGSQLYAFRADLPPLEAGEYYLSDLVGARVMAPDGEVGVVRSIHMNPSADSVVILTPAGTEVELPLVEPWLERVDTEQGLILLSSRDGLIE